MKYEKLKIVMIGAGSSCFCSVTLGDVLFNDKLNALPLGVCLMVDIDAHALEVSHTFAQKAVAWSGRDRCQAFHHHGAG